MNRRIVLLMVIVLLLAVPVVGCTTQQMKPVAAPASPTATAVDERVTAPAPSTAPPETEETSAAPKTEEGSAASESTGPDTASSTQWEEGPITFKSESMQGQTTASGDPFDKDSLTGAHADLPFGTVVTVINLANGKRTTITVNDRLPARVSAIIDISPAAAEEIDMVDAGIVDGRIEW